MGKQIIDIENWSRKEYFRHYSSMDNPFFGITADVDVTFAYEYSKKHQQWFYMRYLHAILKAVNSIEELRYRTENDNVVLFDAINVSPTIGRNDGTFGCGYIDYTPSFENFALQARAETDRVQAGTGMMITEDASQKRVDTIYSTAIPWINFTSLTHPSDLAGWSGIQSLATGKIYERDGRKFMPLQTNIHHGFADGRHAGLFYEAVQYNLDNFLDRF